MYRLGSLLENCLLFVGNWAPGRPWCCLVCNLHRYTQRSSCVPITFGIALLGEADLLAGQICCPRTPPNSLASFANTVYKSDDWIVEGVCAYVPQVRFVFFPLVWERVLICDDRRLGFVMHRSEVRRNNNIQWLLNTYADLLSDNILFNLPYDKDRYERTLEVCL